VLGLVSFWKRVMERWIAAMDRFALAFASNSLWLIVGMKLNSHSIHEGRETSLHCWSFVTLFVVLALVTRKLANRVRDKDASHTKGER
jgi:hypothetical protein